MHGDQGRLINVAPIEVAAADQEVQLVAEEAITQMNTPKGTGQVDEEFDCGKKGGEKQGGAQRRSRRGGRIRFRQGGWLLGSSLRDSTR